MPCSVVYCLSRGMWGEFTAFLARYKSIWQTPRIVKFVHLARTRCTSKPKPLPSYYHLLVAVSCEFCFISAHIKAVSMIRLLNMLVFPPAVICYSDHIFLRLSCLSCKVQLILPFRSSPEFWVIYLFSTGMINSEHLFLY